MLPEPIGTVYPKVGTTYQEIENPMFKVVVNSVTRWQVSYTSINDPYLTTGQRSRMFFRHHMVEVSK